MTVCLIDTSVFCEMLRVPGKSQQPDVIIDKLAEKLSNDETMMLPLVTILETGNHIGHLKNGILRRDAAERFCSQVTAALRGDTPFHPTRVIEVSTYLMVLDEFVEWTVNYQSGLGDLTIKADFEYLCEVLPGPIYIWSKDKHLQAFARL